MKSEWKEVRLGDVIKTNCFSYSNIDDWEYVNYLDTGNITQNRIESLQRIDLISDKLPSRARRKVQEGDIVYSTVRPVQRHYGIIKNPQSNMLVSTGFTTITCAENADSEFIYYFLIRDEVIEHLQAIAEQTVSTYPSIKASDIESLNINLPVLSEQRAIAATLSCLDDKIELNNKINANLEAQAQAIFRSWFVDFEPFRDGEFVDSELGVTPQGWRVGSIADFVIEMKNGGTPSRKNEDYWNSNDIPWIKTGEILNRPIITCEEYISKSGFKNSSAKLLPINSVLIALYGATAAKLALLRFEATTNQACCAMICNSANAAIYLYLNLLDRQEYIKSLAVGSAQQNLSKDTIATLPLLIPPSEIIKTLPYDLIYTEIEKNIRQSLTLAAIRDALLPKLISGEIEVPLEG